jgi:hypothetical protein
MNKTDSDFAVMMYNLPEALLNSELRNSIKENTNIEDSDIIYINKCYEYDKFLEIKQNQLKWLQYKMNLYVFRKKKEDNGEDVENVYPKSAGLNPCKRFPRDEEIDERLVEIEEDLLNTDNSLANYCGVSIIVCR